MNRIQDKALSELIRSIGQVDFPEAFSHFMKKIVPFDNFIVFAYHKDHPPEVLYREFRNPEFFTAIDSHYIKGAYLLDPFYHAVSNGIQSNVHRLFDLAPDKFKQTSYFKEYYKDTTMVDEFAVFAHITNETTITANFGRDKTSKMLFSKKELALVRTFKSVLTILCEAHWQHYQPEEGRNVTLRPITDRLRSELNKQLNITLTPRQSEVSMYILQGHSSLSIALNLNISKETVKVFRRQLYSKCGISSQAELFALLTPILNTL